MPSVVFLPVTGSLSSSTKYVLKCTAGNIFLPATHVFTRVSAPSIISTFATETSISFFWKVPHSSTILKGFKVCISPPVTCIQTEDNWATFRDLAEGTKYKVTVRSKNDIGVGEVAEAQVKTLIIDENFEQSENSRTFNPRATESSIVVFIIYFASICGFLMFLIRIPRFQFEYVRIGFIFYFKELLLCISIGNLLFFLTFYSIWANYDVKNVRKQLPPFRIYSYSKDTIYQAIFISILFALVFTAGKKLILQRIFQKFAAIITLLLYIFFQKSYIELIYVNIRSFWSCYHAYPQTSIGIFYPEQVFQTFISVYICLFVTFLAVLQRTNFSIKITYSCYCISILLLLFTLQYSLASVAKDYNFAYKLMITCVTIHWNTEIFTSKGTNWVLSIFTLLDSSKINYIKRSQIQSIATTKGITIDDAELKIVFDQNFALQIAQDDLEYLFLILEYWKNNTSFLLELSKLIYNTFVKSGEIKRVSLELKEDRLIQLELYCARNESVVFSSFTQKQFYSTWSKLFGFNFEQPYNLECIDLELRNDKQFILNAIARDCYSFQYASETLKLDKEIVLEAYSRLFTISKSKQYNSVNDIILDAVKQNGSALQYASDELKKDRAFVLKAVSLNGNTLQYVAEELKNDKDVVLLAVQQNINARQFGSDLLKNDKEVVFEVLKCNNFEYPIKVVLIGDGAAGKTELCNVLRNGFQNFNKLNQETTDGIEFHSFKCETEEGMKIVFNFYDCGEQEIYQISHPLFFSFEHTIYLIVYNGRSETSRTEEWEEVILSNMKKTTQLDNIEENIVYVGTRCEQIEQCTGIKIPPNRKNFLIGCETGKNIVELRKYMSKLSRDIIQRHKEKIIEYLGMYETVLHLKPNYGEKSNFIHENYNTFFVRIKEKMNGKTDNFIRNTIIWLYNVGLIVYHKNIEEVIINPLEFNNLIRKIVTYRKCIEHKNGLIALRDLKQLWSNYNDQFV